MSFLSDYQPVKQEDSSGEFLPVKGAYLCRIDSIKRMHGTSERTGNDYDFYSLKMQVLETLEGDKATNRYLDTIFSNDEQGLKKLADALFTSSLAFDGSTQEAFDASLENLKDKEIQVRAWTAKAMKKEGDTWVVKEPEEIRQKIKIVSKLNLKQQGEAIDKATAEIKATLPF